MSNPSQDYRLLGSQWLQALSEFIVTNHVYALGSDAAVCGQPTEYHDVKQLLQDICGRSLWHLKDEASEGPKMRAIRNDSAKIEVKVWAFFLRPPEGLKDIFQVINWTPNANISRYSNYDPLTFQGLCDINNFIGNGLCDDWMLACYTGVDGDRRIVGERLHDAIRWDTEPVTAELLGKLDKDDAWLRAATRVHLDLKSFEKLFLGDITDADLAVPTQSELMELWLHRPYDDFMGGSSLTLK